MTEKIEISDVAEADLPACGLVFLEAFDNVPLPGLWFPSRPASKEQGSTAESEGIAQIFRTWKARGHTLRKITVDGVVAGIAEWTWEPVASKEEALKPPHDFSKLENGIVGSEAFAAFFDEQFLDQRMKFFGSRERYCLNWLGISPRFQRRELGKRLVSEGLEIAKAKGVMACLEASPYGIGLYSKLGFKECDTFSFTWEGTNVSLPAMKWEP